MSRAKSVPDEYPKNRSSQNQHIKYVPLDYQLEQIYPYTHLLCRPDRRIRSHCNTDLKPSLRTYYVPEVPLESVYKYPEINSHYSYYKPNSKCGYHEPIQKTVSNDIIYLKYPKQVCEENTYYEQIDDDQGDYNRENDYYEYDDNKTMKYYETPERKYNYNKSMICNNELLYDYIPQTYFPKQNSKTVKNSNCYKYMTANKTESERKRKYLNDEKAKNRIDPFTILSQENNTKIERSKSLLEPVKYDSTSFGKQEIKKSVNNTYISTIFEKKCKLQSINNVSTPSIKTCTVSCQTLDSGMVSIDGKTDIKESFSKGTQTLQLDFTENNKILCTTGTQTLYGHKKNNHVSTRKKEDRTTITENKLTIFTESMDETNSSACSMDYVQLSQSRTNSFLCPETNEQQKSQNRVEPFIFTASARAENSHTKFSQEKKC